MKWKKVILFAWLCGFVLTDNGFGTALIDVVLNKIQSPSFVANCSSSTRGFLLVRVFISASIPTTGNMLEYLECFQENYYSSALFYFFIILGVKQKYVKKKHKR